MLLLDPSIPIGYQCVASDAQLIEHLRKRISSLDRKVLDGLGVTKKLLRHYVDAIEAAGLGDDEAAKEEARRDAATALIEGLDAEVAHLDDIVGLLMENPRIAEDLNAKSEVELQRRREQWESELAQEYQAAVDSLTAKKREIETATQELGALRASITTAVEDILEAPLDALVRHGFLDGLRRSLHIEAVHSPPATPSSSSAGALETITKVDRLKEAAVAWSYGAGVDPYVMQVALAAVLSHRVTLISGANAERLAIALASTFAGDRAVRVSVGTAVFGVADLMNAPASPVGSTCFDRAPTLGDFLAEQTLENTVAVILSGCNRAPPEVVLPEFLLPLGGVSAVLGWSRAATQISTVELSPRVRIIGTLHQGDATYRVPPELSRQLGFIPADRRELEGIPMLAHPVPLPSRITPEIWDLLQSPGEDADVVTLVSWLRERGVGLPPDELMHVLTTYLHLLGDTQRALAEAIAGLLLGRDPVPDLAGLPGTNGESVRQRLSDLSNATAWQEAAHYFKLEEER